MGLFSCSVCAEKDKRIEDLKNQITRMEALVFPQNSQDDIPVLEFEADAILSGSPETVATPAVKDPAVLRIQQEAAQKLRQKEEDIASEAARILSGTY